MSYESIESPVPHQPLQHNNQPTNVTLEPEDHLLHEQTTVPQPTDSTTISIQVHQEDDHLKAVVDNCNPKHVSFFLGEHSSPQSFSHKDQPGPQTCVIEASVELHAPTGPGFEETEDATVEENTAVEKEEESSCVSDSEEECELECEQTEDDNVNDVVESCLESQEEVFNKERGEMFVVQDLSKVTPAIMTSEDSIQQTISINHEDKELRRIDICESESPQSDQMKEESVNNISNSGVVYEDRQSLRSSNESIVKVSDEESVGDEAEAMQAANGDMIAEVDPEKIAGHWSESGASSIFKLHMNGCPLEGESVSSVGSVQEEIEIVKATNDLNNIGELTLSCNAEQNESDTAADLNENSDFSILETSSVPELVDSKLGEAVSSSVSLDASEDSHEVDLSH